MSSFKLRVKIGDNEFDCEGPEETVKQQFRLFLSNCSPSKSLKSALEPSLSDFRDSAKIWGRIPIEALRHIFDHGPERTVSLKDRSPERTISDKLILLIYGIQAFRNMLEGPLLTDRGGPLESKGDRPATAMQLIASARISGYDFDRIDRLVSAANKEQSFIFRGGAKKGSTYYLTVAGRDRAVAMLEEMLAINAKF